MKIRTLTPPEILAVIKRYHISQKEYLSWGCWEVKLYKITKKFENCRTASQIGDSVYLPSVTLACSDESGETLLRMCRDYDEISTKIFNDYLKLMFNTKIKLEKPFIMFESFRADFKVNKCEFWVEAHLEIEKSCIKCRKCFTLPHPARSRALDRHGGKRARVL